ncbi:hypothetical protein ACE6H2_014360 [Prunus campanulata]
MPSIIQSPRQAPRKQPHLFSFGAHLIVNKVRLIFLSKISHTHMPTKGPATCPHAQRLIKKPRAMHLQQPTNFSFPAASHALFPPFNNMPT